MTKWNIRVYKDGTFNDKIVFGAIDGARKARDGAYNFFGGIGHEILSLGKTGEPKKEAPAHVYEKRDWNIKPVSYCAKQIGRGIIPQRKKKLF